jgi:hypothetical protein
MPAYRIKIPHNKLGQRIIRDNQRGQAAMRKAAHSTAEIARNILSQAAPVDLGELKASLRVERHAFGTSLATVVADAPYAGIIERGARPHPVSRAGIESLTRWAMRKMREPEDVARGIAFAIDTKLRERGQKPTWWFKSRLPIFKKILIAEVQRFHAIEMGKP